MYRTSANSSPATEQVATVLSAKRSSFMRVGTKVQMQDQMKLAKKAGYEIVKSLPFMVEARDGDAKVLRCTQVRPGYWAFSYNTTYWEEPAPVLPATPLNLRATLNMHPAKLVSLG